jgi:Glycosyl transferase family 2
VSGAASFLDRMRHRAHRRGSQLTANGETQNGQPTLLYSDWLTERLSRRGRQTSSQPPVGLISILTCVYGGSPASLFRETAQSVLSQTAAALEWVVLAQGDLPNDLQDVLDGIEDTRVVVLRRRENTGIMRGLRLCLEAAHDDYAMPLDADDLLTMDAVQVIGAAIHASGGHPFLYGDEDALVDGRPQNPYFRPAWDPLLNLSSSYVWHPSVFQRELALKLGVFTDSESEFCQDWDTVFRFVHAGIEPAHMSEILYHWRAHPASSTNRPDRAEGSMRSQRHVLRQHIDRQPDPLIFELAQFPLFRGLPEWWIKRRRVDPPPLEVIVTASHAGTPAVTEALLAEASYPFGIVRIIGASEVVDCDTQEAVQSTRDLREAAAACDAPLVVVLSATVTPLGDEWPWEAAGILDLLPDVAFVGGRIVDNQGVVRAGAVTVSLDGHAVCPDLGRREDDPGYYALSLKPQCSDGLTSRFFVARTEALIEALARMPAEATMQFLGVWLGMWAAHHNLRTAYSPLLIARCVAGADVSERAQESERKALAALWPPSRNDSRWTWRQRCAELGEGRPFTSQLD